MSIVDELGKYLAGMLQGVNVSQGLMPAEPARCTMVRGTDLNPSGEDGARVQIIVRGDNSPFVALGDAEEIAVMLDGFEGLLAYEGRYVNRITIENGPAHIGVDQNGRQEYTINIRIFYCD